MPDYRSDNVSKAFQAFFESGAKAEFVKTASYDFNSEDVFLEKHATAGMPLFNPTIDKIEDAVMNFAITKFGKDVFKPTGVNFKPMAFQGPHSDFVSEGTGLVIFNRGNYSVELPFLVHNAQLLPFDVIQLDGERMPYSEENLAKLIILCDKKSEEAAKQAELTGGAEGVPAPFVKPVDKMNSTTSTGFLGNTLSIQDRYRFPNYVGGSQYIVASERTEECLEKLANMVGFDWGAVENVIEAAEHKANMEKFASDFEFGKEAEDHNIATVMSMVNNLKWRNVLELKDKTYITFPELKNGNELTMTDAIVVKDFARLGTYNRDPEKEALEHQTMVLTRDGRCRIFTKGQGGMLCLERASCPGKFESKSFAELFGMRSKEPNYGDTGNTKKDFVMFYNDKLTVPYHINSVNRITMTPEKNNDVTVCAIFMSSRTDSDNEYISGRDDRKQYFGGNGIWSNSPSVAVFLADEVDKLCKVSLVELSEILKKSYGLSDEDAKRVARKETYSTMCAVNPQQKVIPVNGVLTTFFRDRKELNFVLQNKKAIKDDMIFLKTAMNNESLTIECNDKQADKYSMTVSYTDRSKRMFSSRIKKLNGLSFVDVRGILFAIGYEKNRVHELAHLAKQQGRVTAELPAGFDSDKITGATSKSATMLAFNKARKKIFSNEDARKVAKEAIATALTDTPVVSSNFVKNMVFGAQKHANESAHLSSVFEKMAVENKSDFYKETAKALAISSHLFEKTASMLEEKNEYPQIIAVCDQIVSSKEHFDILATDLTLQKTASVVSGDTAVNPNYLRGAILELDAMFRLASEFDKYASEDEDKRDLAQKIKEEEVAISSKENEKPDVKGGKVTPSKLVWRKNRQRMLE